MKLRNKKTGEILETGGHVATVWKKNGYGDNYSYNSLEELNENWEDYKPIEPLIKDKEIISLLRPWIKYNEIEKAIILKVADCWFHIKGKDSSDCWWDIEIHASYSESVDKDYHGELVGAEELCGEEEE